jgi:lipoprotein-releasing system ATP-binding protein
MSEIVLRARGIVRRYVESGQELSILKGVDLDVRRGETVAVLGISGSGKSTLLSILGTLDRPDEGVIEISGQDPSTLDDRRLSKLRATSLGFVFQFHHLLPDLDARENIALAARIGGATERASLERADELLEAAGLADRALHRPGMLSGGERQRVSLARALANRPALVLADEPTGNLDPSNAEKLMLLLEDLAAKFGQAFLVATHDERLAQAATRRMRLENGAMVEGA